MKMQVICEGTTPAELLKKLNEAIVSLGGTAKAAATTTAAAAKAINAAKGKGKATPEPEVEAEAEVDFTTDDSAADEDFTTNDEEENNFEDEVDPTPAPAPKKPAAAAKPAGKTYVAKDVNDAAKVLCRKKDAAAVRNLFVKVAGVSSITDMDKKFYPAVIKALTEASK